MISVVQMFNSLLHLFTLIFDFLINLLSCLNDLAPNINDIFQLFVVHIDTELHTVESRNFPLMLHGARFLRYLNLILHQGLRKLARLVLLDTKPSIQLVIARGLLRLSPVLAFLNTHLFIHL